MSTRVTLPRIILLVEDNPADVFLFEKTLKKIDSKAVIIVAENGDAALLHLHNSVENKLEDSTDPDIVVLDLNLPGISGRAVLKNIKESKRLQHLPIVILSSSDAKRDILETYQLGASCYLTKPMGYSEYREMIQSFAAFWLDNVQLPQDAAKLTANSADFSKR